MTGWSRRSVCAAAATLPIMPSLARAAAPVAAPSGAALFADVERYAAFGPKRTASHADRAVSTWLASEAEKAGARVERLPFTVKQFIDDRARLVVNGQSVQTTPFWFPMATPGPIVAPGSLDLGSAKGRIVVVRTPDGLAGLRALPGLVRDAAAAGAVALIAVTPSPSGEYFAHGQRDVCALPVLLAGSKDWPLLAAAAAAAALMTVDIGGTLAAAATAECIVAHTGGASGPLTVISTPTSAWTTSAGERGTGVALWLALLRTFAISGRDAVFVAASGHELGGAGARFFADSALAPPVARVAQWCHLGASIATRAWRHDGSSALIATDAPGGGARLLTNRSALLAPLTAAFASSPYRPILVDAATARGELALVFDHGYPAFGFEGTHDFFHAPGDLPVVTSPELLAPVGAALLAALVQA